MAENIEENIKEDKEVKKKKCFIITPIGEKNSPTRRHIDGIIDACIEPVLKEKGYDMEVSHRVCTPGSINNRILTSIYSYDLAIANLTNLNPNVMYELAFRHCVNKPVIMIMEENTQKLPFDINGERTVFYTNDSEGTIELKKNLKDVIEDIEANKSRIIDNPIYDGIKSIKENDNVLENIEKEASKSTPEQVDALKFILNKLDKIEEKINGKGFSNTKVISGKYYAIIIDMKDYDNIYPNVKTHLISTFMAELQKYNDIKKLHGETAKTIKFEFQSSYTRREITAIVDKAFKYSLNKMEIANQEYTLNVHELLFY